MKLPNRDSSLVIIVAVAGVVVGAVIGGTYANKAAIAKTFLDVKATDVAGLVLTLVIGLLLALWANKYLNFDTKRRELLLKQLEELDQVMRGVYRLSVEFASNTKIDKRPEIYRGFKNAARIIELIQVAVQETHVVKDDFIASTKTLQLEYRAAVTDGSFAGATPALDAEYLKGASDAYDKVMTDIVKKKVSLFS